MRRFTAIAIPISLALIMTVLLSKMSANAAEYAEPQLRENPSVSSVLDSAGLNAGTVTSSTLSCREGMTGWEPYLSTGINIQSLGGGAYLDFSAHPPASQPNAMEFFQEIRIHQNKNGAAYLPGYTTKPALTDAAGGLGPIIASAPGALWLIGNEPDRGPDPPQTSGGQDDTYPDVYATAYHDVYQFIKQRDPTARVANAGLVEVTPGRLQYLNVMWNTYEALYGAPMPVDMWNIHIYVLPEIPGVAGTALGSDPSVAYVYPPNPLPSPYTNPCDVPGSYYCYADHDKLPSFDSQVRLMRQWMKDHGQQDKPLLLSEFGILYGETVVDEYSQNFTMARATTFLNNTFTYLATTSDPSLGMPSDGNRLVQQWVWFSVNNGSTGLGYVSNLVTDIVPLAFTSVGNMFRTNVASRPLSPNLLPTLVTTSALTLAPGDKSVTATLSTQVVNNGNQLVAVPINVTFYSDAARTQVIGSAVLMDGVPGCASRRTLASVAWPNLEAGVHPYWVKVDSANAVIETNKADNVSGAAVFVGTHAVYLPLVAKNFP